MPPRSCVGRLDPAGAGGVLLPGVVEEPEVADGHLEGLDEHAGGVGDVGDLAAEHRGEPQHDHDLADVGLTAPAPAARRRPERPCWRRRR